MISQNSSLKTDYANLILRSNKNLILQWNYNEIKQVKGEFKCDCICHGTCSFRIFWHVCLWHMAIGWKLFCYSPSIMKKLLLARLETTPTRFVTLRLPPYCAEQSITTGSGPIGVNVRKSYRRLEILPPGRKSIQPGWKSIHPGWKSNRQTAWKSYRWLEIFPPMWLDLLPP